MSTELRWLYNGRRTVPVKCSWRYCPKRRAAVLVRSDTGRVVETRTAMPAERQLELFDAEFSDCDLGHTAGPVKRFGTITEL